MLRPARSSQGFHRNPCELLLILHAPADDILQHTQAGTHPTAILAEDSFAMRHLAKIPFSRSIAL